MNQLTNFSGGQEIPEVWIEDSLRYGVKILDIACGFGFIKPGYDMKDYILDAVESKSGYETVDIWGRQGSKKSNRTLQIMNWVYNDWDVVLKEIVLMPTSKGLPGYESRGFLEKMRSVQKGQSIPCVGWDDLTVSLPSSTFKTDTEIYGAVDAAWAAIRTKIRVMILNNPLIDRITKNIKDNVTLEVMIGPNQTEMVERWFHLVGLKTMNSNFFKVQVEPLHRFDWRVVPSDVFKEYQNLREEVADYALSKLGEAFGDEETMDVDVVTPIDIMNEIDITPSTLNDMLKRHFLPHKKVNGRYLIARSDYEDFKKVYLKNPSLNKRRVKKNFE